MIVLAVWVVSLAWLVWLLWKENPRKRVGQRIGDVALSMLSSTVIALLLSLLLIPVTIVLPKSPNPKKVKELRLLAMRDEAMPSGSFVLGSGSIEGEVYYFFYRGTPDGGYKAGKIRASECTVYEKDRQDGKMVRYVYPVRNPILRFLFEMPWPLPKDCKIFIPRGSLKQVFTLNGDAR